MQSTPQYVCAVVVCSEGCSDDGCLLGLPRSHLFVSHHVSSPFLALSENIVPRMFIAARRLYRTFAVLVLLFVLFQASSFCWTRSRFQTFLYSRLISWDDFPAVYTETLRSENFSAALQTNVFDYGHVFPRPGNSTEKIPPIIHFIWFSNLYQSRPELSYMSPGHGSNSPQKCMEHNPRFEVKIWNETSSRQLLAEHYAWFLPVYDAYRHPIQRIDATKYFVLLHYGGVYMDMDISCRRSLDPLLDFPAWFPMASTLGVNNDLMASRAQHPVLTLMVKSLERRNKNLIFPYLTIFWSTGPQFTSDMLKEWFLLHEKDVDENDSISRGQKKHTGASLHILPTRI